MRTVHWQGFLRDVASGKRKGLWAGAVCFGLWLLSKVYALFAGGRRTLYRNRLLPQRRLAAPVIAVGNLTTGGTGKTPLIREIAQYIVRQGKRPVILTRGYMPGVGPRDSDEVLMLRRWLKDVPVLAGADRARSAASLPAKASVDCFLMDDGFQHLQVWRDVDIVVVNAADPFDNGHVLPRGLLREPLTALRAADCLVLTKISQSTCELPVLLGRLARVAPGVPVVQADYQPVGVVNLRTGQTEDLSGLTRKKACLVSALGDPQSFHALVEQCQVPVADKVVFPDHHTFTDRDVRAIEDRVKRAGCERILMSEKDAVKWLDLLTLLSSEIEAFALQIKMKFIDNENELFQRIDRVLHR